VRRQAASRWAAAGLLAVLVLIAWWGSLHGEFTYDDKVEVIGNRTIRVLENWRAVLAYNPSRALLILSYAVNFDQARFEPFPYHLVDTLLHAVNAGLAMVFAERLARMVGRPRALVFGLVAGGLWALHPLQTESVSYVTGRSEQLVATWYLLACWAWLRWLEGRRASDFALAHFAFLLGLVSKEVAVTMPLAFLLLAVVLGRVRWKDYAGIGGTVLLFAVARVQLYGVLTTHEWQRPPDVQLWTTAEVVWRYLQLSLVPVGQSVFHDHPATGLTVRSASALLGLVGLTAVAWRGRRKNPLWAFAWLWFLLVLAPSSLIPLKETMSEHRLHLSLLGVCLIVADLLVRPRVLIFAAVILAWLGALTIKRNAVWQSEVALWQDAVDRNPASCEAWYGLGEAHRFSEHLTECAEAYAEAVACDPSYHDARVNQGICLVLLGEDVEAEETWLQVLRRSPSSCKAHNNLGLLYARHGEAQKAMLHFQSTISYCPRDCTARWMAGDLLAEKLGDVETAIRHYSFFLETCPAHGQVPLVRAKLTDLTW